MELIIKKAILHILDTNTALPVYSQEELDLSEEAIVKFIGIHLQKIHEDRAGKRGEFQNGAPILSIIQQIQETFVESSIGIAARLYDLMTKHVEIPRADLLVAEAEIGQIPYLAIMKFNYREGYTHYIDYDQTGTKNKIIVHRGIFPSESQKNDEGALIDLRDMSVRIVEKEYPVNGENHFYFSELFLGCTTNLSEKESLKIVHGIAKEMTKKYYGDSFEKSAQVKDAIYDNLETEGNVDAGAIAQVAFAEHEEIKQEYVERVKKAGIQDKIQVSGEQPVKAYSKQKLKMDNGIELSIPMAVYRNKEMIEFINHPDGTMSILIKQVHKIVNR